jgi:hypothetical protein
MKNKIIITLIALVLVIGSLIFIYGFDNSNQVVSAKLQDYETQSYNIVTKEIKTRTFNEPYGCYLVDNSLLFKVQAKSTTKTNPKSTTPKTTPKPKQNNNSPPLIQPRSNNRSKNTDGTNDFDQDLPPDNPRATPAPYNKRWRCLDRLVTRYDYIMTDSASNVYTFASGQSSPNAVVEGWDQYQIASPIAKRVPYENFFLAGSDPIFSPLKTEKLSYQSLLIPEPLTKGRFDLSIDQVGQTNNQFSPELLLEMNKSLMKVNSTLNNSTNKKQVNIQIIFLDSEMDDYIRQLCIFRDGCNKNDLILTIQLTPNKTITRIQGYSWSTTGFDIAIELDSDYTSKPQSISNSQEFSTFISKLESLTISKFQRKEMSEFKYIKEELIRQTQRKNTTN